MKKTILVLTAFLCSALLCIALCFFFCRKTPLLQNEQMLPGDLVERQYRIDRFCPQADGGLAFSFETAEENQQITLTVSDIQPFKLLLDGCEIYAFDSDADYYRTLTITSEPLAAGTHSLLIYLIDASQGQGELLVGNISVMKFLMGTPESASHASMFYRQLAALAVGVYMMLIFSCLSLYRRMPREKYLLALSFVAFASLAVLLADEYAGLLHISQRMYASIRSPMFLCPVLFVFAIDVYLFDYALPARLRRFVTMPRMVCVTLLMLALQYLIRYNLNYLLRVAMIPPLLLLLCRAARREDSGAVYVALGSGFSYGARAAIYLINTLKLLPAGELVIYLRFTQIGYLIDLVFCMVVVFHRFADKFAEAENLAHTLDLKVIERTKQLEQARRREHEVMTNVLHDLRTPIFHLQGCLDMIQADEKPRPEMILLMRDRTEYLKNLAENLFLAAKLEENSITFNQHEVDLKQVLQYVCENERITAQGRGITLRTEAPDGPAIVITDGFRIRQVFENLIENAVKYSPDESVVQISVQTNEKTTEIIIANPGPGIAPDALPHVFERFYHGTDSSSSGLGLYIAKSIMQNLHGDIRAESQDGLTRFTVSIANEVSDGRVDDEAGAAD